MDTRRTAICRVISDASRYVRPRLMRSTIFRKALMDSTTWCGMSWKVAARLREWARDEATAIFSGDGASAASPLFAAE